MLAQRQILVPNTHVLHVVWDVAGLQLKAKFVIWVHRECVPMSSKQMKVWCAEAGLMFGCRQCSYEQQANEGLVC